MDRAATAFDRGLTILDVSRDTSRKRPPGLVVRAAFGGCPRSATRTEMSISKGDGTRPTDWMLSIYGMSDLSPREQIVLSIIAWHDGRGGAWPSLASIAGVIKKARSTVADVVKSLELKGRIRKTRGRTTNRYTVAYDEPFTVRENQPVSNVSDRQGDPNTHCLGVPDTNKSYRGAAMKNSTVIGWCRDCGFDRMAGDVACCACGVESKAFVVPAHERERGELTMPFGVVVTGLDTPEARRIFLGAEGQAALQDAYRTILAGEPAH